MVQPTPLFKKLHLGNHASIHVLNAPASFEPELARLDNIDIQRKIVGKIGFALAFAVTRKELDAISTKLVAAADDDAVVWIAYPKSSSKKYTCEFNRDSGWDVLGAAGYEPVSLIAIDEDWSALRLRKVEHIKTMKRSKLGTISEAGKRRATTSPPKSAPTKSRK